MSEEEHMRLIYDAMWKPVDVNERIQLYRDYGITIGSDCFVDYGVWIEPGIPSMIRIEDNVIIAHGAKILGHDSSLNNMFDFPIVAKETILEKSCYIGTGAIIMPGVRVGAYSIVGAGALVTKDIAPGMVCYGNPAKEMMTVGKLLEKYHEYNGKAIMIPYFSIYRCTSQSVFPEASIDEIKLTIEDGFQYSSMVGSEFELSIVLSNNSKYALSSYEPYPVFVSYHVYDSDFKCIQFEGHRTPLIHPAYPNNSMGINMKVESPLKDGVYTLRITLVQEGYKWFDEYGVYSDIKIEVTD